MPRGGQTLQAEQNVVLLLFGDDGFIQNKRIQNENASALSLGGIYRDARRRQRIDIAQNGADGYLEMLGQRFGRRIFVLQQEIHNFKQSADLHATTSCSQYSLCRDNKL
ncbi:hypothetical protein D3C71_1968780 [compost metagenome]